jgi:hypothetical protein
MTADIVTRLREKYLGQLPICLEAADEIERLRQIEAERDQWQRQAVNHD